MGYTLHIEKNEGDISLDEWIEAVQHIGTVRLSSSDVSAINPVNGDTISIPSSDGDVDVLFKSKSILGFGAKSEWHNAIYYSSNSGAGFFKYQSEMEDRDHPVRCAAKKLAEQLNAQIIGDEGEEYSW